MPGWLSPSSVDAAPGPQWCRAWSERVDEALCGGLERARLPTSGVAVVALGSYARRQLCPASDIDLLLLHDGWRQADLEALVRGLCYPLWDAGLQVGHAVHKPRAAVVAAGERVDTATALIERRLVVGDAGLVDDLESRERRWLSRAGQQLLVDLSRADAERHSKAGLVPGVLEPDLKNGSGGLRDLDSLRWAAACLLGEVGLDPLVGARYVGAPERRELADAADVLITARCALHLYHTESSGRPTTGGDRLRLDLQDEIAVASGHGEGPAGGNRLLRDVGLAMRAVAHVHGRTWPLLLADARRGRRRRRMDEEDLGDGLLLRQGLIEVADPATLRVEPSLGLRAVAAAAQRGTHLGRATTTALRRELAVSGSQRWDPAARRALLEMLRCGAAGLAALADADQAGLLSAYLPQWSRVRGYPWRNPFHRFDLDTHGSQTVAELVALGEGDLAGVWRALDDPDALLLGAWLHDIGKAWPGDHSVAGEAVAREWLLQMGFAADRAEHVARLVRLHLLLPDAATRRDLDDPDELAVVAEQVADRETLDGLYILCLADARATGPAAHSDWKDGLIRELHGRVRRLLDKDGGAGGSGPSQGAEGSPAPAEAIAAARELIGSNAAYLDELLASAPGRYLASADGEQLAEHAQLLAQGGAGEMQATLRPGPSSDTLTLSVVSGDRRELIADCAGVLAGHGVVVLEARAFTRGDGVALDWFTVRPRTEVDRERVTGDLRRARTGDLDVATLVARRERRRDERPPALPAPIPVMARYENTPSPARVEVRGPDSPGVLYRVVCVLAEAGLDVVGARVATLGPEVRDVFFVRPTHGEPDVDDLTTRLRAAATRPA